MLLALAACTEAPRVVPAPPDSGPPKNKRGGELPEADFGDGPIAKVNGVEIPRKAFDIYYNRFRISLHKKQVLYPIGGAEGVMSRVVKRLVAEEVIRQKAKEAGITAPEDRIKESMEEVQARLKRDAEYAEYHRELGTTEDIWRAEAEVDVLREMLVERSLAAARELPETEVKALWAERAKDFQHPVQVDLSRIRFDIGSGMSGDQIREVRKKAELVRGRIAKGEKFEEMAKTFSDGASSDKGGRIGWLAPGALPRPIAEALWKVKPGGVSDVLEDDRGIYIFKVHSFRDEGTIPYEEVRSQLLMELIQKRQNEALGMLMNEWRRTTKVEILVPQLEAALTWTSTTMPSIPERADQGPEPGHQMPQTLEKALQPPSPHSPP
jgi:parvulin-like peptidyl-prolyl isomerase